MRVTVHYVKRDREYSIAAHVDGKARQLIGRADKVLLRDARFNANGNVTGELEGAYMLTATGRGHFVSWLASDRAYVRYARTKGDKVDDFEIAATLPAPVAMVYLAPRHDVFTFDPLNMTEAEAPHVD